MPDSGRPFPAAGFGSALRAAGKHLAVIGGVALLTLAVTSIGTSVGTSIGTSVGRKRT